MAECHTLRNDRYHVTLLRQCGTVNDIASFAAILVWLALLPSKAGHTKTAAKEAINDSNYVTAPPAIMS